MVYLIVTDNNQTCKIGYSNTLTRIAQLQTGNAEKLNYVATIDWGTRKTEKHLHNKFNHLKLNNEWFTYTVDILNYINKIKENPYLTENVIHLDTASVTGLLKLSPNALRAFLYIQKYKLENKKFIVTGVNIAVMLGLKSRTSGATIVRELQELQDNLKYSNE
jgi:hypothetical protein